MLTDPKFPWNVNSSRHLRDYVVPENETAVINNVNICNTNVSNEKPLILIVVCSAVANDNLRQAIRDTWMQKDHSVPFDIRTVFLLGRLMNDVMQRETLIESNKHGDIIQEGFIDSYLNLLVKYKFWNYLPINLIDLNWRQDTEICDDVEMGET